MAETVYTDGPERCTWKLGEKDQKSPHEHVPL